MAKVTGGAAYLQLKPFNDGINQGLQYWGGIAARRGEEERARAEREGIRRKKEISDWETKYNLKEGDFLNQHTGFDSYDATLQDFSKHTMDKYVEYNRMARQALENGDLKTKSDYEMKMMKLKNGFKEVTKGQEAFAELNKKYLQMVQDRKMSGVDAENWEKVMEAVNRDNNLAMRWTEDDKLVYTGLKTLSDGTQEPYEVAHVDLINGNFRPYERQQLSGDGGIIDNILHNLGKKTTDKITGLTKTTSQVWDDVRQKAALGHIDSLLESDEVMADLYYQMINGKSKKRNGFSNEEKNTVRKELLELVRGGYDETEKKTFESGRAANERGKDANNIARGRLAETKRHNRAQEALGRARLAVQAKGGGKQPTKKDVELGTRKWNINQVMGNNDVSFFRGGDFEWAGKEYQATGAEIVGNSVVISTRKGKKITVPKSETVLNDLFNSFEGTNTKFDDVVSKQEYAWRDERAGTITDITNALDYQYSSDGSFIGDDGDFAYELKKLYPNAKITTPWSFDEKITVNGNTIDLTKSREQVEKDVRTALGEGTGSTGKASNKMSDEDFDSFLKENGL